MGGQGGMVPEEYARPMPQEPHPAFFAPVSVAQSDHSNHRPQQPQNYDAHPPPASPGPIPIKTENDDTKAAHDAPLSPISPTQPYSPHSNVPSSRPPIFAPDNPSGPNGMLTAEHRPGQIAHPNMDLNSSGSKHEWKHSLCECSGDVGTCMTGVFCPCVLYGKTSYRLGLKSEKKDPTEMLGWSWANGKCGLMAMTTLCGLCGLFPLIHRTRLRHQYQLQGSLPSDIVKSCCCCCCSTIQNEREIRDREERANRWAGPSSGTAYERPSPMVYEPPPQVPV
ncbi:PLAC8 family-domain-containing protein [Macrophomina phaseolina]|uniref:PLAC8 family-domain-containing protein n=1 Tax=Macrophomina phaseolina TaxID=35725 RepID=A0ABQ8FPJ0_9PEZI|nr:PLAC8 family-domain-containing protein [Macrophomina phaseolina]